MKIIGIDSAFTGPASIGFVVNDDMPDDLLVHMQIDGYQVRSWGKRTFIIQQDPEHHTEKRLDELSLADIEGALLQARKMRAQHNKMAMQQRIARANALQNLSQRFGLPLVDSDAGIDR